MKRVLKAADLPRLWRTEPRDHVGLFHEEGFIEHDVPHENLPAAAGEQCDDFDGIGHVVEKRAGHAHIKRAVRFAEKREASPRRNFEWVMPRTSFATRHFR